VKERERKRETDRQIYLMSMTFESSHILLSMDPNPTWIAQSRPVYGQPLKAPPWEGVRAGGRNDPSIVCTYE
jgi:hypothetical protein